LVRTAELVEAVWGSGAILRKGNITNHIAKIRKALGCDPHKPKFIKTVYGKEGYRFVAGVKQRNFEHKELLDKKEFERSGSALETNSHLFAPVYLGANFFDRIDGKSKTSRWLQYKDFPVGAGRLCVADSGFGVWHVAELNKFSGLTELAAWRKKIYREILDGKHVLNASLKGLLSTSPKDSYFHGFSGSPGYVFSAIVLGNSRIKRREMIRRTLQVLSCPSALESRSDAKDLVQLELQFLNDGIPNQDLAEFGLPGIDMGFASWDGLSYFRQSNEAPGLESDLVEFEIAIQTLWWQCKCFADVLSSGNPSSIEMIWKLLPDLKRRFSQLRSISSTESPSQRTMVEAVMKTSRINEIFEETIGMH